MEDAHLTLRLPEAVVKELEREAEQRGIPKSRLVREAVASYFVGGTRQAEPPQLLARDLARQWDELPHLTIDEASALEIDLQQARAAIAPPGDPWA